MKAPVRRSGRPYTMARVSAPMVEPALMGGGPIQERHGGIDNPGSRRATETLVGRECNRIGDTLPVVDNKALSHVVALQTAVADHNDRSRDSRGEKPALDRATGPRPCWTASAASLGGRKAETGAFLAGRVKCKRRPSVMVR